MFYFLMEMGLLLPLEQMLRFELWLERQMASYKIYVLKDLNKSFYFTFLLLSYPL